MTQIDLFMYGYKKCCGTSVQKFARANFLYSHPIWIYKYENRETKNMATLRESAKAFKPKTTKSITELKSVNTELDIETKMFTDKDGKEFTIQVIEVEGEEYRVPISVVKQLKEQLSENSGMTKFKVKKTGEGLNTSYTVIPLD